MGGLISKLWEAIPLRTVGVHRKRVDALVNLKRRDTQREKKYMGSLLLYSVILYLMMALFFYFYYEARDWKGRATQILPFLLFPVLIFGVIKLLRWYFVKRITSNQMALEDLREEKKKILEEVKDKESYKKAKEILDRFDPASSPPPPQQAVPTMSKTSPLPVPKLRQRPMTARGARTPNTPLQRTPVRGPPSLAPNLSPQQQMMMRPQPTARPILPRERGTVDKLVDFLVGDGPSSRYALICRHCYSHNGMALQEEFEYLAFKCAYCGVLNPSKKVRPQAPRLPAASPPSPRQDSPQHAVGHQPLARGSSASDGGSQSDSDVASSTSGTPIITPPQNTQTEESASAQDQETEDPEDLDEGEDIILDDGNSDTPSDTQNGVPCDTQGGEEAGDQAEPSQGEGASTS